MAAMVLVGVLAVVGGGCLLRSEIALRRRAKRVRPMSEPHSLVRMLTTDEELQEAVERAVGFEQGVARSVAGRIERYREASHVAPVVALGRDTEQRTLPSTDTRPTDDIRDSA